MEQQGHFGLDNLMPERYGMPLAEPEPMEGIERNNLNISTAPSDHSAASTYAQATESAILNETRRPEQRRARTLITEAREGLEARKKALELVQELEEAGQRREVLREEIAEHKAVLTDLKKFIKICKELGMEDKDFEFAAEGNLIEQAKQMVREGYAKIARGGLNKMAV